jgi:hypothetical protein
LEVQDPAALTEHIARDGWGWVVVAFGVGWDGDIAIVVVVVVVVGRKEDVGR